MRLLLLLVLPICCWASAYERFEENGKIGLRDDQGKVILPPTFEALGWSDGQFTLVGEITGYKKDDKWGLINLQKKRITPALFESLSSGGADRIIASKRINPYTIKFGCIDLEGNVVIPFQYDEIVLSGLRAIVMNKEGSAYKFGVVDLNDHSILPVIYKNIRPLGSLRYAVTNFDNKVALCAENGTWITGFEIDSISRFHAELAIFHQEWRKGVIDQSGQIRIKPGYRDIRIISPGELQVLEPDRWSVKREDFSDLLALDADELIIQPHGAFIRVSGKTGLVDNNFTTLIPPSYDILQWAGPNLLLACRRGRCGLIRPNGEVVLPLQFTALHPEGRLVRGQHEGMWQLYDTVGIKKNESFFERMESYNGTFFPVRQRGHWGGVDLWGNQIIACVYDTLLESRDLLTHVKFQGHEGIIDNRDRWIVTPQRHTLRLINGSRYLERMDSTWFMKDFDGNILFFSKTPPDIYTDHLEEAYADGTRRIVTFQGQILSSTHTPTGFAEQVSGESEGLTRIRRHDKYGFVDNRGRLRIANRYEAAHDFSEGLAAVQILGKWGYIDKTDNIVIQPTFDKVHDFRNGVAEAFRNGRAGLIDTSGKVILALTYDSLDQLEGYYIIRKDGLLGLAERNGRLLIEPRFESLELISQNRVIVRLRGKYGILTREGLSVVPTDYNTMTFDHDRKLFLVHKHGEWKTIGLSSLSQN